MERGYPITQPRETSYVSTALLVLRVVTGLIFLMHGWQKLDETGLDGVEKFFESIDVPMAGVMAPVVTFLELIGGVMLIAGVLTRIVSALFVLDMLGALFLAHLDLGFFVSKNGYEFVLLLAAASLALAIAGPGAYSVDDMVGLPGSTRTARGDDRARTL